MQTYGLTNHQIAEGTGRTLQTVDNWRNKPDSRPVYLDLALRAIVHRLEPLDTATMDSLNLVRLLGIPAGTERYWRMCGSYPQQARMAAAWAVRGPTHYQKTVLRHIDTAGAYYRVRGSYRARGRSLPIARASTIRQLEIDGLVIETDGRVRITPKARTVIYKE